MLFLFCWLCGIADAQIHVLVCANDISSDAMQFVEGAKEEAELFFYKSFQRKLVWIDGCDHAQDSLFDFRLKIPKGDPYTNRKESLAFMMPESSIVVLRYNFAERLAKKRHPLLEKILGAAIVDVLVIHIANLPHFRWNGDDIRFINAGIPQGFTNEIVEKVQQALLLPLVSTP